MNALQESKITLPEIKASDLIPALSKALGKKLSYRLLTCGLGLLLGLNSFAAVEENKSTLVYVNTKVADREKFDALIAKEFPKAKVLYTAVDEEVNDDVKDEVLHGVSLEGLKKYKALVIIGDFKKATVPEDTLKSWMTDKFASAKKQQAPQLHLLSTARKPPTTYLRWVEVSGGSYRQLKSAPSGSYE